MNRTILGEETAGNFTKAIDKSLLLKRAPEKPIKMKATMKDMESRVQAKTAPKETSTPSIEKPAGNGAKMTENKIPETVKDVSEDAAYPTEPLWLMKALTELGRYEL